MVSKLTAFLKSCIANGECQFLTYKEFGERFGLGSFEPAWADRRTLDLAGWPPPSGNLRDLSDGR